MGKKIRGLLYDILIKILRKEYFLTNTDLAPQSSMTFGLTRR